mmetsp:Transcript_23680/g.32518  ORF Transcript_23680/g.32518 Transcript_23680/m.32518 type:complete len:574 (+) Transcript_23680:35-1756(+)
MRLLLLLSILGVSFCSKLVKEQLSVYKKIIEAYRYNGEARDEVTPEDIVSLIGLVEGNGSENIDNSIDQSIFHDLIISDVRNLLGGKESLSWGVFEKIVDTLYGNQISDDPYMPQEVHISLTGDSTTMKVMWASMESLENPFVQYLPNSRFALNWDNAAKQDAVSFTYEVPQKWWPVFTGKLYETDMQSLTPGQKYSYRVGGFDSANNTLRYSKDFTFTASPISNNPNRRTSIATLADHGTFMLFGFLTVDKLEKTMKEMGIEAVFVAGGLSYAGIDADMPRANITSADEFEHIWDLLAIQNEPIAANYPWMVGNGNHDMFYDATALLNRYKMPQTPALGTESNFWYAFDYGNSHWISLSSEHPLGEGSPQRSFLVKALEAATANRAVVPWVVVTLHKPIYCSADGSPLFASQLEELLLGYDVDITVTGHMHLYERVHPVQEGKVTVFPVKNGAGVDEYHSLGRGPVHVVQGHAGAMQFERFQQPAPEWSAFRMANGFITPNISRPSKGDTIEDLISISKPENFKYTSTYGFGVMTFYNATHMHFTTVSDAHKTSKDASPLPGDEFWIVKSRI